MKATKRRAHGVLARITLKEVLCMYTVVPYRSHREVSHPMNSLFDDRFFRSFFDMGDMVGNAGFRVDVKEEENAYLLEAEMPGVKQDDISLNVENDVLTIAADFNTSKKEEKTNYLYSERRTGHMERSFNLEGIEQSGITADYVDGVLTVTLPKEQPAKAKTARKIAIGNGSCAD